MSLGSPIVPIRIPEFWLKKLDEAIASNNLRRWQEPWNRTSWILDAIKDKIAHQSRSRQRIKKRKYERLAKLV